MYRTVFMQSSQKCVFLDVSEIAVVLQMLEDYPFGRTLQREKEYERWTKNEMLQIINSNSL